MRTTGYETSVDVLGSSSGPDPRLARHLAFATTYLAAKTAGTPLPCPVCAGVPEAITLADPCPSCALDAEHRAGGHDAQGEALCSQLAYERALAELATEERDDEEQERRRDTHAAIFADARLAAACRVAR